MRQQRDWALALTTRERAYLSGGGGDGGGYLCIAGPLITAVEIPGYGVVSWPKGACDEGGIRIKTPHSETPDSVFGRPNIYYVDPRLVCFTTARSAPGALVFERDSSGRTTHRIVTLDEAPGCPPPPE